MRVITINTSGPQGPVGPQGPAGITNTSFLVTTSSFNDFTASYKLDSSSFDNKINAISIDTSFLVTTSSFNDFTASYLIDSASFISRINISNTGSFSGSFTGSLFGTSSWAKQALTASYITGSIFNSNNLVLSSSYAITASYVLTSNTFATSIGNGVSTNIGVTHNLGTRDLIIQLYDNITYETVLCDIIRTNVNFVTCSFVTAPSSDQYRVVIKA